MTADTVKVLLDNMWVLVAAVLVIFMQAGFALLEAGLTRAKSVGNIMMKNLMDFTAGALVFFAVGYAFAYGTSGNGFIGLGNWFLGDGLAWTPEDGGLAPSVDFIFQLAFAATAATIVSGAMAERTKFKSYLMYSLVITGVIYPIVVHWTWGGGWLSSFGEGFSDFAGSSIVHMTGGVAAFAGAAVLGSRIGKYDKNGKPRAIVGHSTPFAVLGTLILLVGWYGFNGGSQLAADFPEVGNIALTTTLAAAAGAVLAMVTIWIRAGKPDVAMAANGALAGLVGITAGTADVGTWGALAIGALSGIIVVFAVTFFDRIRIDDPVGAISVHGVCGAFGTLAVGIFATENSLLAGDGLARLGTQAVGVVAIAAFVAVTSFLLFTAIKVTVGLRASEEEELDGLDVHEHGAAGYGPEMISVPASKFGGGTKTAVPEKESVSV
jgi:Amt family ammonium transporter